VYGYVDAEAFLAYSSPSDAVELELLKTRAIT